MIPLWSKSKKAKSKVPTDSPLPMVSPSPSRYNKDIIFALGIYTRIGLLLWNA